MTSAFGHTVTVWHALFLREVLDRFFGSRGGWAWLVIEPASHMVIIGIIYSVMRGMMPGNIDTFLWICVGMLGFFLFRRTAVQSQHAVDCNKAFFAFRQVRPFDAAFARSSVEGFSMFLVSLAIILPLAFWDKPIIPRDPFLFMITMGCLWLLGLGYGMITSVIQRLVPESSHIFTIILMPLYFLSGVLMPVAILPIPFQSWIMYNPIAHGIELCRYAFLNYYIIVPETSLYYLFIWALFLFLIGMILYKLFETRLVMR